ncbi:MAG: hypothetical protein QOC65_896 [Sphingomonadales bacterium]|nr:hypothetical protein [Sphingomonadales bacterium]
MKKFLMGAAVALSLAAPATVLAQRAPNAIVVVVDTARLFRECTACVAASAALQAQDTNFQQRRQALLGPLQTEEQAIARAVQAAQAQTGAARTTSENALRPRIEQFNQRRDAAARELQTLQQTFESTRVHVATQLSQRVEPIYTQVMTSRGANLVIPSEARLANAPAIDVTNDVLALLNQQVPSVSITPMPQQQQQPAQPAQPGR